MADEPVMETDETTEPEDDQQQEQTTEQAPEPAMEQALESGQQKPDPLAELRAKYKTDEEIVKGFKELSAKLHQRDEDAVVGRVFRQYEKEFRDFLASKANQQAQAASATDKDDTDVKLTPEEFMLLQSRIIDPKTGELRDDADPRDVSRFKAARSAIEKTILAIGLGKYDALEQVVNKLIEQREQQWKKQATIHQMREKDFEAVRKFYSENAGWLYRDGKSAESGLRPEGEEFMKIADEVFREEVEAGRHDPETGTGTPYSLMHEVALARYVRQQRSTPKSDVKPQAKHKSSTTSRVESIEEKVAKMIDNGATMSEVAAFLAEHDSQARGPSV